MTYPISYSSSVIPKNYTINHLSITINIFHNYSSVTNLIIFDQSPNFKYIWLDLKFDTINIYIGSPKYDVINNAINIMIEKLCTPTYW